MPTPKPPSLVRVRYVGPMPEVDVPALGLAAVKRGDVVEVSPEAAGSGPSWRPVADGQRRDPIREYRDGARGVEVRDLGSGLLSQIGNWEPVEAESSAKAGDR